MTSLQFPVVKSPKGLVVLNRAAFDRAVSKLTDGVELLMIVKSKVKRQSNQPMRYYRGVVIPDIAEACGYDDPEDFDQVHQSLAWKFLRIEDHPTLGYPRRRSTAKADLTADEMTAYIQRCIDWAENQHGGIPGCKVRRPNEIEDWEGLPMVWQPDTEAA